MVRATISLWSISAAPRLSRNIIHSSQFRPVAAATASSDTPLSFRSLSGKLLSQRKIVPDNINHRTLPGVNEGADAGLPHLGSFSPVIPAKAGIQGLRASWTPLPGRYEVALTSTISPIFRPLDSRFRGNDGLFFLRRPLCVSYAMPLGRVRHPLRRWFVGGLESHSAESDTFCSGAQFVLAF